MKTEEVFFTMQPAKIHFGDLAGLDSNECQYQLDGQKCNFSHKLSREPAISNFEMKKKRKDTFFDKFLILRWKKKEILTCGGQSCMYFDLNG